MRTTRPMFRTDRVVGQERRRWRRHCAQPSRLRPAWAHLLLDDPPDRAPSPRSSPHLVGLHMRAENAMRTRPPRSSSRDCRPRCREKMISAGGKKSRWLSANRNKWGPCGAQGGKSGRRNSRNPRFLAEEVVAIKPQSKRPLRKQLRRSSRFRGDARLHYPPVMALQKVARLL